jgi:NAD(P)-dependent dehydrogenase (short-subunit alcohol dehydrogenase family)
VKIAITGGSGGIGSALIALLLADAKVEYIYATFHSTRPQQSHPKLCWHEVDLSQEASIESWLDGIEELDWLINAAGILHTESHGPEKTIRRLDAEYFLRNVQVNTLPMLLLAKHGFNKFRHGRPGIFASISARVGSIEENYLGGWYSYRCSKAALNMGIKTLSIEWKRSLPNVVVAAVHPGTTDTNLSKPFQRNVPEEQLFSPEYTASTIISVLRSLGTEDSGNFWSFDGTRLPW